MKKLTVIILSLVLSFGVVGCSSNSKDDSTQEQQEQQKDTAATASEISTLLKDMYIVLKDSNGGTKDCKDKLVNYGKDINDAMLENKEYGSDMQNLKDATEDYDLEKIAKYVCDILNEIEGSDKYSIEIKSTDNTDKSNTDKSNSNQNTKSNGNNKKSTNKNNNNNKNTNKNNEEEYQSGDYGDYTKCPNCKKMTFHPDGYCENCGYGKSANEDGASHSSECANCGSATINDDGTCPYCGYQN